MDYALLLLWRLRFKAFFRRMGKTLRTAKGIGLTLIGVLIFIPWFISIFTAPQAASPINSDTIRRFGPLVLLAYTFLSLLLSTGEKALFFSPAEIDFLFPGPFSRKAVLRYKIYGLVGGLLLSSIIMVLAFGRAYKNVVAAYFALVLTFLFFQLLAMAVGLASDTIGVMARSTRRRVVLGTVLGIVVATILSSGLSLLTLAPIQMLQKLESSPVIRVATLPFKSFIQIYVADHFGMSLCYSILVCIGLNAALLWFIFAIDAQYLESSAVSSAKLYDRVQRIRKGGLGAVSSRPKNTKRHLGMLPWWGGVGPILWRQLSTAAREPLRMGMVFIALLAPGIVIIFIARNQPEKLDGAIYFAQGFALYLSIFVTRLIAFDFRGDVDRMDQLKSLPVAPVALVIGQILTPVLIFTIPQWIGLGAAAIWLGGGGAEYWAVMTLTFPISFLIFGIENWLFLVFPTRSTTANPTDVAAFGRQILMMIAKIFGVGLTIGVSALVGIAANSLLGTNRLISLAITIMVATGLAAMLIPLMVHAFLRYDVARDTPA